MSWLKRIPMATLAIIVGATSAIGWITLDGTAPLAISIVVGSLPAVNATLGDESAEWPLPPVPPPLLVPTSGILAAWIASKPPARTSPGAQRGDATHRRPAAAAQRRRGRAGAGAGYRPADHGPGADPSDTLDTDMLARIAAELDIDQRHLQQALARGAAAGRDRGSPVCSTGCSFRRR